MLGGNSESVAAVNASMNRVIKKLVLDDDTLTFTFEDGLVVSLTDEGQSCCEHRYMKTDDELSDYAGATLTDIEVVDAPDQEDQWGEVHEIQFLRVHTSKGVVVISAHNEHNGYYGGFCIRAKVAQ